jgi:hypothetical protein
MQFFPDRVPGASFLEVAKDIVDRRMRRISLARKISSRAAGAKKIKDGVDRFCKAWKELPGFVSIIRLRQREQARHS